MGLLDLGTRTAIVRFVAQLEAKNDYDGINLVYSTSMFFLGTIGLTRCVFIWLYTYLDLSDWGSGELKYRYLLLIIGFSVFLSFCRNAAEGVIEGKQNFHIKNIINSGITILSSAYLYTALEPGNAIVVLALTTAVAASVRLAVFMLTIRLSVSPAYINVRPSLSVFIKMLRYGTKSFINGVSFSIQSASPPIIIGLLLGPAYIVMYSIPASILSYLNNLIDAVAGVFLPLFTEGSELNFKDDIKNIYTFFSRHIIYWTLSILVIFNLVGAKFIDIWLNNQLSGESVSDIILILSFALFVEKINPLGSRLSMSMDKHLIFAKLRPLSALLTIALSSVFVVSYGVEGIAISLFIVHMIFSPIFLVHSCRLISMPTSEYIIKCVFLNVLQALLLLLLGYALLILFTPNNLLEIFLYTAVLLLFSLIQSLFFMRKTKASSFS